VNSFPGLGRSEGTEFAVPVCVRSNFLAAQPVPGQIEVSLDGLPVALPAERHSTVGIRAYLEMLALEQQRILCSFTIDGQPPIPPNRQASLEHSVVSRPRRLRSTKSRSRFSGLPSARPPRLPRGSNPPSRSSSLTMLGPRARSGGRSPATSKSRCSP